jgi:DNA end-binding protein Ku
LAPTEFSAAELELTKTLVQATTADDFDYSRYKDEYTEKLTKLIESKVEGKELVATPATQQHQIINLMDALKASVAQARGKPEPAASKSAKSAPATEKKMAASARERKPAAPRKKKSG